ncbi:MAG: hypothetical protein Q8Q47_00905, partial [Ignavibacteriaceae bacterium]|nr:hypothetical protein [Ignavibacteriaceae bacterium]
LYVTISGIFGTGFTSIFSATDEKGVTRILGETVSHTGYIIMIFQIFVSRISEKFKAIPTFNFGLFVAAIGMILLGYARVSFSELAFLGILFFAVGEMITSPRIQEYITWIAPKEKAGLYMGTNFLAVGLGGALSGVTYTSVYGYFRDMGNPEYVWYVLAANLFLAIIAIYTFIKIAGEFKELDE